MSAVVLVSGAVRASRPLARRGTSEIFGTEVSVLTNVGDELGETIKVMIWERDSEGLVLEGGAVVRWVCEVDAGKYGLGATFKRAVVPADLDSLKIGATATAWDLGAPAPDLASSSSVKGSR